MRNNRITPKFGGSNPYEKLTVFQLQKRARRGDPGAEYEIAERQKRFVKKHSPPPPIQIANQPEALSG